MCWTDGRGCRESRKQHSLICICYVCSNFPRPQTHGYCCEELLVCVKGVDSLFLFIVDRRHHQLWAEFTQHLVRSTMRLSCGMSKRRFAASPFYGCVWRHKKRQRNEIDSRTSRLVKMSLFSPVIVLTWIKLLRINGCDNDLLGIFYEDESHKLLTICPRHRDTYGLRWCCNKKNCAVPRGMAPTRRTEQRGIGE